jgi:hypothetical protein
LLFTTPDGDIPQEEEFCYNLLAGTNAPFLVKGFSAVTVFLTF